MDRKLLEPFIDAVISVLPMIGMADIKHGNVSIKEKLMTTKDVTVLIGLSQGMRGNVAYDLSEECAKNIASA